MTIEVNHIWKVDVAIELKIKLFCFFTIRTMVWMFIAVEKRYLKFSVVLKLPTTQNKLKRTKTN